MATKSNCMTGMWANKSLFKIVIDDFIIDLFNCRFSIAFAERSVAVTKAPFFSAANERRPLSAPRSSTVLLANGNCSKYCNRYLLLKKKPG